MTTTFDLACTIDSRQLLWQQIVPSKSGKFNAHNVRCWQHASGSVGYTCSDCPRFTIKGTCRHISEAQAQQAREDAAYAAYQSHEPALSDPTFDDARALLANAPTDFDSGEPVVVVPAKRKISAAQAYEDLFGAA
jgi:hypothetical protein